MFPELDRNRRNGTDVESWIKAGLLDSVLTLGDPLDRQLVELARAHNCPVSHHPSGTLTAAKVAAAYTLGVQGIAVWDCDASQDSPATWPFTRRLGHRAELASPGVEPPPLRTLRLKTIGGCDVLRGLWHAAYSGG